MMMPERATTCSVGIPSWCLNHPFERAPARFYFRAESFVLFNGVDRDFEQVNHGRELAGVRPADQGLGPGLKVFNCHFVLLRPGMRYFRVAQWWRQRIDQVYDGLLIVLRQGGDHLEGAIVQVFYFQTQDNWWKQQPAGRAGFPQPRFAVRRTGVLAALQNGGRRRARSR